MGVGIAGCEEGVGVGGSVGGKRDICNIFNKKGNFLKKSLGF